MSAKQVAVLKGHKQTQTEKEFVGYHDEFPIYRAGEQIFPNCRGEVFIEHQAGNVLFLACAGKTCCAEFAELASRV